MPICTFFGHRDCPDTVKPKLLEILTELIEDHGVHMFYVGDQGRFDAIARSLLKELRHRYPQIDYAVVLSRMPGKAAGYEDSSDTMLPEGIECIHSRYSICWRNDWMLRQSDFVVTYITRPWGGAYRYAQKAVCQARTVINIE